MQKGVEDLAPIDQTLEKVSGRRSSCLLSSPPPPGRPPLPLPFPTRRILLPSFWWPPSPSVQEHEEKTKVKNIMMVELGRYEVDTWYYSPFPDAYAHEHKLFVCEVS